MSETLLAILAVCLILTIVAAAFVLVLAVVVMAFWFAGNVAESFDQRVNACQQAQAYAAQSAERAEAAAHYVQEQAGEWEQPHSEEG